MLSRFGIEPWLGLWRFPTSRGQRKGNHGRDGKAKEPPHRIDPYYQVLENLPIYRKQTPNVTRFF